MTIASWDQTMYAFDKYAKTVTELTNTFGSTYYNGNFKGAHRIPITASSAKLNKGSGTTTYDLLPYIKNDGTYIRLEIKASGYTMNVVTGDIYLIFEDPLDSSSEVQYTIQQAVDNMFIDPVAFRYTSMSSTSYLWDTTNLFTGGRTDQKNFPYVYLYILPYAYRTLKKVSFYTNKDLNTTYDGFIIGQTNISKINETGNFPRYTSGYYIPTPFAIDGQPDLRLNFSASIPAGTDITASYGFSTSSETQPETWTAVSNYAIIYMPLNQTGKYLWLKFFLETTNEYITPTLKSVIVEQAEIDKKILRLALTSSGRLKYPQGDVTIAFTGALVGIGGGFVEPFTESFTPVNITPIFNPNDPEYLTASATFSLQVKEVVYSSAQNGDEYLTAKVSGIDILVTKVGSLPL